MLSVARIEVEIRDIYCCTHFDARNGNFATNLPCGGAQISNEKVWRKRRWQWEIHGGRCSYAKRTCFPQRRISINVKRHTLWSDLRCDTRFQMRIVDNLISYLVGDKFFAPIRSRIGSWREDYFNTFSFWKCKFIHFEVFFLFEKKYEVFIIGKNILEK